MWSVASWDCVRFGVVCGIMGVCKGLVWSVASWECVGFGVVCGIMGLCKVWCGLLLPGGIRNDPAGL